MIHDYETALGRFLDAVTTAVVNAVAGQQF